MSDTRESKASSSQKRTKRTQHSPELANMELKPTNTTPTPAATTGDQQQEQKARASIMSSDTYAPGTDGAAVRRIRTPHDHDVLSGRGGSVNGHPGNVQFREWVRVRKNDYNLAPNKAEKARVAKEVIALVKKQSPSGRFLQKDPGSLGTMGWWIELDEDKVMAKTSQALREGAPQIRAAHKEELIHNKLVSSATHTKRRSSGTHGSPKHKHTDHQSPIVSPLAKTSIWGDSSVQSQPLTGVVPGGSPAYALTTEVSRNTTITPMPPLGLATEATVSDFGLVQDDERPSKRVRVDYNGQTVHPTDDTPPLMPVSHRHGGAGGSTVSQERHAAGDGASHSYTSMPPAMDDMPMLPPPIPPRQPTLSSTVLQQQQRQTSKSNSNSSGNSRNGGGFRRTHSLAMSENSFGEMPPMEEEFVNPFEDETELLVRQNQLSSTKNSPFEDAPNPVSFFPRETSSSSTSGAGLNPNASNNQEAHALSSAGTSSQQPGVRSRNAFGNMSSRSLTSVLSDLPDSTFQTQPVIESDFHEGVKAIYDALHTDADEENYIPTYTYPYRGGAIFNSRRASSLASRGYDGRQ